MSFNSPTSAAEVSKIQDIKQHKEFFKQQERSFDKNAMLETINQLKIQNEKADQMLKDTQKTNKRMLFWTIVCAISAVVSAGVAIIAAILK